MPRMSIGTLTNNTTGNAATATSAASAEAASLATNVVSGISITNATVTNAYIAGGIITNAWITNSTLAGDGAGLTNIPQNGLQSYYPTNGVFGTFGAPGTAWELSTNASFTYSWPSWVTIGVFCYSFEDINNTSGSPITISVPTGWVLTGTATCTNNTEASFYYWPGVLTNVIVAPIN